MSTNPVVDIRSLAIFLLRSMNSCFVHRLGLLTLGVALLCMGTASAADMSTIASLAIAKVASAPTLDPKATADSFTNSPPHRTARTFNIPAKTRPMRPPGIRRAPSSTAASRSRCASRTKSCESDPTPEIRKASCSPAVRGRSRAAASMRSDKRARQVRVFRHRVLVPTIPSPRPHNRRSMERSIRIFRPTPPSY